MKSSISDRGEESCCTIRNRRTGLSEGVDFSTGTLVIEILIVVLVPVRAWERKEINGVGSEALLTVCASDVLVIATLGALTVLVGRVADEAARVFRDSIGG